MAIGEVWNNEYVGACKRKKSVCSKRDSTTVSQAS